MAGRIVLELKDKLKKEDKVVESSSLDLSQESNYNENTNNNINEAISALVTLGYTEKEAESAVSKADKNETVENIIKSSLKALMG